MNNPYYVDPSLNILPGLTSLSGATRRLGAKKELEQQQVEQDQAQERFNEIRQGAVEAFRSGDPDIIAEFSIQNPEFSNALNTHANFRNERTKDNYFTSAVQAIQDPSRLPALASERASFLQGEGVEPNGMKETMSITEQYNKNPQKTIQTLKNELAAMMPERWKEYREATEVQASGGISAPAEVVTFQTLTAGLSPEEKARAVRVKLGLSPRASETAVSKAEKAFATESAKLGAKLGLQPQVTKAVKAAENEAKQEASEIVKGKSDKTAWDVYNNSMSNLSLAMEGTETGPFVGLIPAVTSSQQIAEGSVAIMAPVLKQMFRAAGEGVFTDKDQELLMKMVPTRKDSPEARLAKIQGIDSVVRAKLGVTDSKEATPQQENKQASELSDEELLKIAMGQ